MAEGPITLTLKGGSGYQEPWLVISGNDFSEVSSRLATVPGIGDAHLEAVASKFVAAVDALVVTNVQAQLAPPQVPAPPAVASPVGVAWPAAPQVAPPVAPPVASAPAPKDPNAAASQKQLAFIQQLGGFTQPGLTMDQASQYIQQLLAAKNG